MDTREFLSLFTSGLDGYLALSVGGVSDKHWKFVASGEEIPPLDQTNVFFGPAVRTGQGNTKEDCLGTNFLWVDVDRLDMFYTLPPTLIVASGHGYHMYWKLSDPLKDLQAIEQANKMLAADTKADACYNVNRFLRVPDTLNAKGLQDPVKVKLVEYRPDVEYLVTDFVTLSRLNDKTRHKIRTGDRRGYKSRSERDWAIITDLIKADARDGVIGTIFDYQPCGEKAAENENYLSHTIAKARDSLLRSRERTLQGGFEERENGYYYPNRGGFARVSTFVIHPRFLLDGSYYGTEDALVGDVVAAGHTWKNVTFARSSFTSVTRMDRTCPIAAWQWLGNEPQLRRLLPFLMDQLLEQDLPRVIGTLMLGLHFVKDEPYFVGNHQVLTGTELYEGSEGPIGWIPSNIECPTMNLAPRLSDEEQEFLGDVIWKLNKPESIAPMLGWYAASAMKPWLEKNGLRFPIMSVMGTRGSGKTTLIQRVFMPLFGQADPKSYDAGTTKFVTLSLLGSTNAIPVAFSEFRFESVEKFLRYVLLSYDTGHDPRGRPDLSVQDFELSAPFSIDGEDPITDPAAKQRIVTVHLHPEDVLEGSEANEAYNSLQGRIPEGFGGWYIQRLLQDLSSGNLDRKLRDAKEAMHRDFPQRLPDRIRNNHIVTLFGLYAFSDYLDIPRPEATVLTTSIDRVFNLRSGRARTLADDFIEDLINALPTDLFGAEVTSTGGQVFFQLATAYAWWSIQRRRQGRAVLERDAILSQIQESEYYVEPQVIDKKWMYGLDLQKAYDAGLDVPTTIDVHTFKVHF